MAVRAIFVPIPRPLAAHQEVPRTPVHSSDSKPQVKLRKASCILHGRLELISNFSRFKVPLSAKKASLVLDNCGACRKIFTTLALADYYCAKLMSTIDKQHLILSTSKLKRKLGEMEDPVTSSTKVITHVPLAISILTPHQKVAHDLQLSVSVTSFSPTPSLSNIKTKAKDKKLVLFKEKNEDRKKMDIIKFVMDSE
ncbi:hypothetical protein PENSPDRAFT_671715 [Peniophora sp. CONT]|nr:hypothetical protein PENSPDRAFT_671715 [Peniophora sp. CONT]